MKLALSTCRISLLALAALACREVPGTKAGIASMNARRPDVTLKVTSTAWPTSGGPDAKAPILLVHFEGDDRRIFGTDHISTASGFVYSQHHVDTGYTPDPGLVALGRDGTVFASTSEAGRTLYYPIGRFSLSDLREGCRLKKINYDRNVQSFTLEMNRSFGYEFPEFTMVIDDSRAGIESAAAHAQQLFLTLDDFPACGTPRPPAEPTPKAILMRPEGSESCLKRRWNLSPAGTQYPTSYLGLFWGSVLTMRVAGTPVGIHFSYPREDGLDEVFTATVFDPRRVRDKQLLNFVEEYKMFDFTSELVDAIGTEAILQQDTLRFKDAALHRYIYPLWTFEAGGQRLVFEMGGIRSNTASISIVGGEGPLVPFCTFP